MQQVRYFVVLAETLNFTRAAEQCNVSQPALTRAIQQLEHELGGPLLRREGRNSHLSELGHKMLPLLRQCYESAISAKSLATAVKKGEVSTLSLGTVATIDLTLLIGPLGELQRQFPGVRLRLRRGSAAQVEAMLKAREIEIAIGGPMPEAWERLDTYPLFTETFDYIVRSDSDRDEQGTEADRWNESPLLLHRGGLMSDSDEDCLKRAGIDPANMHQVESCHDLETLLRADIGIGLAPASALRGDGLRHRRCTDIDINRPVAVYTVAGRRRSREAAAFVGLLRGADWTALEAA